MIARQLWCAGPAIVFAGPLAALGCPLFICLIVVFAIFGLGWQITEPRDDVVIQHIQLKK